MSATSAAVLPEEVLPVIVWENIFLHVNSNRDLKAVSLVCLLFDSLVRDRKWRLTRTWVTGDQIQHIAYLPVVNLKIKAFSCNDDQLTPLSGMSSLRVLDMTFNRDVTAVGISMLRGLTLRELNVGLCEFEDAAMSAIGEMASLEVLKMDWVETTDVGLCHLSYLQKLTSLDISNTEITDVGLCHLSKLHSLIKLEISRCSEVTDAGLAELVKRESLRELGIFDCDGVTPACRGLFSDRVNIIF